MVSAQRETSERGRYGASEDDFKGEYVISKLSYDIFDKAILSLGFDYDNLKWKYMIEEKIRLSPSFDISFPDYGLC